MLQCSPTNYPISYCYYFFYLLLVCVVVTTLNQTTDKTGKCFGQRSHFSFWFHSCFLFCLIFLLLLFLFTYIHNHFLTLSSFYTCRQIHKAEQINIIPLRYHLNWTVFIHCDFDLTWWVVFLQLLLLLMFDGIQVHSTLLIDL